MAGLGDMFGSLFGSGPQLPAAAPPVTNFPTPEDAEYARKYGFGYGSGNEAYIQGENARVLGRTYPEGGRQPWRPMSGEGEYAEDVITAAKSGELSRNLDLTDPANAPVAETMGTSLAQAALAADRMPVAALGFDPSQAVFDTKIKDGTLGGAYSPDDDFIYSTTRQGDPSNILHESIHRGLSKLRADPALTELFKNLPSKEEHLVRYLMATQAGDPEVGRGAAGDKQIEVAKALMGSGLFADSLKKLDYAAQDAIKNRRPGGPR